MSIINLPCAEIDGDVIYIPQCSDTLTVSSVTISGLTASRAVATNGSKTLVSATTTATELDFLSGVTSAVQTQLDGKQATITGAATTITSSNLTAGRALISNGTGKVAISLTTDNEIGHLSGVNSSVQGQLDDKVDGPAGGTSTNDAVVTWDGGTGRLVKNNSALTFNADNILTNTDANGGIALGATAFSRQLTITTGATSGEGGIYVVAGNASQADLATVQIVSKRSDSNGRGCFSGTLANAAHRTDAAVATGKLLGRQVFGGNHTDGDIAKILYTCGIAGVSEGTFSNNSTMPSALVFYTGSQGELLTTTSAEVGTERMRIDNTGCVGIGITVPTTKLHVQGADGATAVTVKINATSANITSADTFIAFTDSANTVIGSIAGTASSGVIAYNTFTGSHFTKIAERDGLEVGHVLEACCGKFGERGQLFRSRICETKASKKAIGVYGGTDAEGNDLVLSIGTGFITVANRGENIEIGDYLTSSDIAGHAEKQVDDIYRSSTLAKATDDIIWAEGEERRTISCIYLGG
jgi:hypothetical protein